VKVRFVLFAAALMTMPAAAAPAPVEVMILGTFHMSNPGRDMHDTKVDDVLSPKRQGEIKQAVDGLAAFKPTMVDVEWPADIVAARYASYLKGTLKPSRNEVVQLGFRLARTAGLATVHGIDADGDFPYEAVDAYAKAHGQEAILVAANADIQAMVDEDQAVLGKDSIGATLRHINAPAHLIRDNGFYRTMLRVGGGKDQPGAALMTAWFARNAKICARLIQLTRPGDRVVAIFGSGHAFLLRQCVKETPGFKLVEANAYLPH